MKLVPCLTLVFLASCAAVQSPTPVPKPDTSLSRPNRISLYAGQRNLDEDDWSPVDEQATVGLEYAREEPDSAVGWEVGFMGSSDDDSSGGVDFDVHTREVYAGVRKTFGEEVLRPYAGAGLSLIKAEVDVSPGPDDDDSSAALYMHAGLAVFATDVVSLAFDLRFLLGSDLELGGSDVDADYGQLAFVLGFGF